MHVKKTKIWLLSILGGLIAIGLLIPLPIYSEVPGLSVGLKQFIKVDQKKPKVDGDFNITAVSMYRVTGLGALLALMNPHADLLTEDEVTGGVSNADSNRINQIYMNNSLNAAKAVAFKAANVPFKHDFNGIYVMSIQNNSKFKNDLHIGDTITKVNEEVKNSAAGFQSAIRQSAIGQPISITFQHGKQVKTVSRPTVAIAQTGKKIPGVGISLTDNSTITSDTQVDADMGDIGGPSGGLMFSLELYDALSSDNLADGRIIAGTGTIDDNGQVGEIGGIDKKVIAAGKAGAKIFFAPYIDLPKKYLKYEEKGQTNYQLAKKTAQKYEPQMKVVPVKTFQEAVDYLKTHPNTTKAS
ncbi:PDZ domain-containing protein [Weissella diestrammenae]|uniref:endopeptidase La n=1 Tax=Weissella diestrammenae TaxID=1162633 RepID=A0A7G9T7R7_9LACO|nr:PDZ domain-containing protein [Weissella diestrammenae]QNN76142.1 PDZ domain-containing protein [Weissella diestrammenae]